MMGRWEWKDGMMWCGGSGYSNHDVVEYANVGCWAHMERFWCWCSADLERSGWGDSWRVRHRVEIKGRIWRGEMCGREDWVHGAWWCEGSGNERSWREWRRTEAQQHQQQYWEMDLGTEVQIVGVSWVQIISGSVGSSESGRRGRRFSKMKFLMWMVYDDDGEKEEEKHEEA